MSLVFFFLLGLAVSSGALLFLFALFCAASLRVLWSRVLTMRASSFLFTLAALCVAVSFLTVTQRASHHATFEARQAHSQAVARAEVCIAQGQAVPAPPAPEVPPPVVVPPAAEPKLPEPVEAKVKAPAKKMAIVGKPAPEPLVTWRISSADDPQTTRAEAERFVLLKAQREVTQSLRNLGLTSEWTPSLFLTANMLKAPPHTEERNMRPPINLMYVAEVDVQLTPEVRSEILRLDREAHAQDRMLWLARILAALVALLAAVAGYLRLDDMTKGYYTGWLRLSAGLLAGGALVLLLV